jgi:hypothetical protein
MHYYITTALQQLSSFWQQTPPSSSTSIEQNIVTDMDILIYTNRTGWWVEASQALSVDKQSGIHENLLHLHACTQHSSYKHLLTNPIDQLTFNFMYVVYHTGQHQKILNKWCSNLYQGLTALSMLAITSLTGSGRFGVCICTLIARPDITIIHTSAWAARFGTGAWCPVLATLTFTTKALGSYTFAACAMASGRTYII